MKQPLVWIGVLTVLASVSPLLRADSRTGAVCRRQPDEASASTSWVMMAGCPEACPTTSARGCRAKPADRLPSVPLDGNAYIMQLNLEQDGIEGTKYVPPSYDPGPGQDLVTALNRLNDGLCGVAARKSVRSNASGVVATASPRSIELTDDQTALRDAPELAVAPVIASWARETYEGTIDRARRLWRRAAHAVGMALIRSLVTSETIEHAAFQGVDDADPERQPPMDPMTAAWIQSVQPEETNESSVDRVPLSGSLPFAAAEPSQALDRVASPYTPAPAVDREIGCGAIGLPRPISAPEPTRTIGY